MQSLQSDGWLLSPKSVTTPTQAIQWMGKLLDGTHLSITNLPSYCSDVVRLWLRLATSGYCQRTLRRLVGKLVWATRPGRAAAPFLAGCFAWLHWGPCQARFTPPKVLRGLLEAISIALHPWVAEQHRESGPIWFVDAAKQFHSFYVGMWAKACPIRILKCPPWIKTQQAAELFAIECAIRIAANQGQRSITVTTDNIAAAHSTLHRKASVSLVAQNRILRRIQNLLRWSDLHVSLAWIPSHLNPADPLSRWAEFLDGISMLAKALLIEDNLHKDAAIKPNPLGFLFYRT